MIWVPVLILAGLIFGRCRLPRWVGWGLVFGLGALAHWLLLDADPIVRMVGICAVLLGAMKGLVYAEWGGRLSWGRYFIFGLFWFGMDPGSFTNRREGLSWKGDVMLGAGLMVVGTVGAWLVWSMGWTQILVMFVPMSLGFHFGALRVLKGGLRRAGFPVRTLFPNVLKAQGVGDFWSRRWNVGYSQMMQRLVGRPVEKIGGKSVGVMAVFVISGLLHELAISFPVQTGFGLPTAYFTAHGLLVLWEAKLGRRFGRIPALLTVTVPLGFLFTPVFQDEVIARCLQIFDLLP